MGETVKLVGAMMRLNHNTKFKGGLDFGGTPGSVASSSEHLDLLQLFCGELKDHLKGLRDPGKDHVQAFGDGDMITAKLAETQIRALVNSELEACVVLHETQEFWQQRLERPAAGLRNWVEMGPLTWRSHSVADCWDEYLRRFNRCNHLLRTKILSAGSLQLHLTHMKQAYVDGELKSWNKAALRIIRQALSEKEGTRGHPWVSLASATPTPDMSPPQPLLRSTSGLSSGKRRASSGGCVSDSSVVVRRDSSAGHDGMVDRLLRLGREKTVANEPSRTGALVDESQTEDGQRTDDAHRGRSERLESAVSEEKEEEGFVLARDSRGLHDDGRDTERGLGEGDEGDGDQQTGIMEALIDTARRLVKTVVAQQQEMAPILLGSCAKPSPFRRNWVWVSVATPAVLAALCYMYKERSGIRKSLSIVRGSFWQFVKEHISEPFWGIYNDIVHNQPLMINNKTALADSSQSLKRMLEAFIKDTRPELSQSQVANMAATGDMSVVSREYEKSIIKAWKNFVAGDIVRMVSKKRVLLMLIQVQFIKRELLIATTAIGQLARENELNLRMMATVPAFLLAWAAYRGGRPVYYMVTSEKSRKSTFTAMRMIVLAMERLLNMRHREGTWQLVTKDIQPTREGSQRQEARDQAGGSSESCTRLVTVSANVVGTGSGVMVIRVLDELDLGKLMMLVYQLRKLIRSGPRRLDRRDFINSQEDLAELVGERGLVSVGQQLRIVQRMQRSYRFLAPSR